jgi:Protein of unknown function (DUF3102)
MDLVQKPELLPPMAGSNSLADLAHRIKAEHDAANEAKRSAISHAIAAGDLLIEAKDRVSHGDWLPWLEANVGFSERTAQAYMRLAREYPKLDPAKAQRVADLSFRETMRELASDVRTFSQISEQQQLNTLEKAETTDKRPKLILQQAKWRSRQESLDMVAPPAGPTLADGRAVEIWSKRSHHLYCVAIHPNETGARLRELVDGVRAEPDGAHVEFAEDAKDAESEADALEQRAKALRKEAEEYRRLATAAIALEVKRRHGVAFAFAETHDFFVANEERESELLRQPSQREAADLLFRWIARDEPGVTLINCSYWGDMAFLGITANQISSPQNVFVGSHQMSDELLSQLDAAGTGRPGWSGIGSPDNFYRMCAEIKGEKSPPRAASSEPEPIDIEEVIAEAPAAKAAE